MTKTLSERMKQYEGAADYELLRRVPVVIRVDGKNFSRFTRKMLKPYDPGMMEAMVQTMTYMVGEMEGGVFAYQNSDEISIILRNDQSLDSEPWHGNRLNKLCSVSAALATLGLQKALKTVPDAPTGIGDAIFDARAFPVPSLNEALNYLIYRQGDCIRNAINAAAQIHLSRKMGKKTAYNKLLGLKSTEKVDLLFEECGVDFEDDHPAAFRLGVGSYRVPVVQQDSLRKKWQVKWNLDRFIDNKEFYYSILQNGHDLIRSENIIEDK